MGAQVLYDSLIPAGIYSQAFNGPEVTQFGNAINLASNPAGAALGTVTVGMANFGPTAFSTSVTFNIYKIAAGGVLGSLIATDTKTVAVPVGKAVFNATFDFSSQNVALPSTIVYGITLNALATDCATTVADCGNDPNPIGSLNVDLNANVSAGSDVYPGDVFVKSLQADTSGTALGSNLGYCTGAPTGVLSTFQGVPVGCTTGYGSQTETPYIAGGLGIDEIPAVEFTTVG